jgi:kynurenine formamidase
MSVPAEPSPASHQMTFVGDYGVVSKELGQRPQVSFDRVTFNVHGLLNTHIDAFAHIGFKGYGFNGHAFEHMVTMDAGAMKCDVLDSLSIVTRGVFVDVPRKRGIARLAPGDYVRTDDIEEEAEQVRPGDAFIIRVGGTPSYIETLRSDGEPPRTRRALPGLHSDCVELLAKKDIAVLGSDSANDTYPNPSPELCQTPIHVLCLTFYGIPLVHNMDLDALGEACATQDRNDFLFVINALNIPRGTGSLCTPLAVL